jgi:hypothetical protein
MEKKLLLGIVLVFLMGWASASIFAYMNGSDYEVQQPIERNNGGGGVITASTGVVFEEEPNTTKEKPSPKERVFQKDIFVFEDEVVIKIDNPQWAIFTDSNSMDPLIDSESKAIEIVPGDYSELQVGDIVAYESRIKKATVIHRIVFIGRDQNGWYALMKGDNNEHNDPERVRFDQVKRVVVAIIY